jgi:hypothetical protein
MKTGIVRKGAAALVPANASRQTYTNGITTINLPSSSGASRISISIPVGSAHEGATNIGAATFTRNCIGISNYRNTGYLQNKMVNLMGASFSTSGTREKTVVTIEGGSAAVEELAMDVLVPSMTQPLFHKWEMTQAWEAALNQPECPYMEAFHATSFAGGLANNIAFKGGYGSDTPSYLSEREEALEALARDWHSSNYGANGMTVIGCGIDESILANVVAALQTSSYGTARSVDSSFNPGSLRVRKAGASVALIGADVTGADAGVAAVVAASLGGRVLSYSSASVLQFSSKSTSELLTKIKSLNTVDFASAQADAALAHAVALNSGDASVVQSIAEGKPSVDVLSASQEAVQELATQISGAPKSLVVMGDIHAFPQQQEI